MYLLLKSFSKMTSSPDPNSDRKRLSADELIAVLVALFSIGAILFWSISQKDGGMNRPFIQLLTASSPSTATPLPTLAATPSVPAATTVTPSIELSDKTAAVAPAPSLAAPASPTASVPQTVPFVAVVPQIAPSPASSAVTAMPVAQPKQFTDVPPDFWASVAIAALSAKGILDGFPDGSFQPNKPITRAEFAGMIRQAFDQPASRDALRFNDLKPDYWAVGAIDKATQTRFMSGFPDGSFQPNRQIPRLQVLLALAAGLNLKSKSPADQVLSRYQDAQQIPKYAISKIAAATEAGLVLNDDVPKRLRPKKVATRAEAAALIYKVLGK